MVWPRARLSPPSPSGGDLFSLCASECFDFDGGVGPGGGARRGVGGNAFLSILFFICAGTAPPPSSPPPVCVCVCVCVCVWCGVQCGRAPRRVNRGDGSKKKIKRARVGWPGWLSFFHLAASARGGEGSAPTRTPPTASITWPPTPPPFTPRWRPSASWCVCGARGREEKKERRGANAFRPPTFYFHHFALSRSSSPGRRRHGGLHDQDRLLRQVRLWAGRDRDRDRELRGLCSGALNPSS